MPGVLHRVNGYDALVAAVQASLKVRDGRWIRGAPTHVLVEFLEALEAAGFYLGVPDLTVGDDWLDRGER